MVNKCPYRRRQSEVNILGHPVVICFQISIFEPLKTAGDNYSSTEFGL